MSQSDILENMTTEIIQEQDCYGPCKRTLPLTEALWIGQEERCAVCRKHTDTPSLDHCHATSHIRGILCSECNKAAGLLQEDVDRIETLARYIGGDDL